MATCSAAFPAGIDLPRAVLRADALVCGATGLALLVGFRPIGEFMGLGASLPLAILGVGLLPYAAALWWASTPETVERRAILVPAVLNVAWVLASAAIIAGGAPALTTGGKWAVALLADVVALLAIAQFALLRRAR